MEAVRTRLLPSRVTVGPLTRCELAATAACYESERKCHQGNLTHDTQRMVRRLHDDEFGPPPG